MKVQDVPADELVFCDSCNERIKKRQHELTLVDPEGDQELGRWHLSGPRECWKAAERFTMSEYGPDRLDAIYTHPERCGRKLKKCDGGAGDWQEKEKKK